MNLQQLRYVRETVRQGLNLTEAARALHTSQPGVSKQILDLEQELGVDIFVRKGKRLVAITEPGQLVVRTVERLLAETENLKRIGEEYSQQDEGGLTVATTHTQARYALPGVVQAFRARYPRVRLALQEGNPIQVAEMVVSGAADIGIATEALTQYAELVALPGYSWRHCVITPVGHPLLSQRKVRLHDLARYPIITYGTGMTGRAYLDETFAASGLKMDIVLTAIDADVIKTYVELGLGIGIIAAMAYDSARDTRISVIAAEHLFEPRTTRVALRRAAFHRRYTFDFIEMFAPHLTPASIAAALSHESG